MRVELTWRTCGKLFADELFVVAYITTLLVLGL